MLSEPRRQSPVAIVANLLSLSALREMGEVVIPLIIVGMTTGRARLMVLIPVVAIVVAGMAVLRWWRMTFVVEGSEFIIRSGVLQRSETRVPVERIQQIATEQGIIQRIFGVRAVSIDTAGSAGSEVTLTAVSNEVVAELRTLVVGAVADSPHRPFLPADSPLRPPGDAAGSHSDLHDTDGSHADGSHTDGSHAGGYDADGYDTDLHHPEDLDAPPRLPHGPSGAMTTDPGVSDQIGITVPRPAGQRVDETVVHLTPSDLVTVGLVRPNGQVLAAVAALLSVGAWQIVIGFIEEQATTLLMGLVMAMMFVVALLITSALGTMIHHYDLMVRRSRDRQGDGLRLTAGLFTRRERFARASRVQIVHLRANPLERTVGRASLVLTQASAGMAAAGAEGTGSFHVPGVTEAELRSLRSVVMPTPWAESGHSISPKAKDLWRTRALAGTAVLVTLAVVSAVVDLVPLAAAVGVAAVGVLPAIITIVLAPIVYRRWEWGITSHTIWARNGVVVTHSYETQLHKAQAVRIDQGWGQRRRGLADLVVATAGGTVRIPHLDIDYAVALRDGLAVRLARHVGSWM